MQQEHYDNVKTMLDRWAECMSVGGQVGEGAPRECLGAPDARVHSIEDLEIEVDKLLVRTVDGAVYELPTLERTVVLVHYGLNTANVWRPSYDGLFDQAIESLFSILKTRIVC